MSLVTINENYLRNIAGAIREKSGTDFSYKPRNMAAAISAIPVASGTTTLDAKAIVERALSGIATVECDFIGHYGLANSNDMTALICSAERVEGHGCYGCKALHSISMPNLTHIDSSGFSGCIALKEVYIPSIYSLSNWAFGSCVALEKIDLHNAMSFEGSVFGSCTNLRTIILRTTAMPKCVEQMAPFPSNFELDYEGENKGYIYVPASMLNQYRNFEATYPSQGYSYWTYYSYRAIEDYPEICG